MEIRTGKIAFCYELLLLEGQRDESHFKSPRMYCPAPHYPHHKVLRRDKIE